MDDLGEFTERAGINNLYQAFHPLVQRMRIFHARRAAHPAFCAMFRCPALADIHGFARKQGIGLGRKLDIIGQVPESLHRGLIEMSFRKIEIDTCLLQGEVFCSITIAFEQRVQRGLWTFFNGLPKV